MFSQALQHITCTVNSGYIVIDFTKCWMVNNRLIWVEINDASVFAAPEVQKKMKNLIQNDQLLQYVMLQPGPQLSEP